MSEQTAGMFGRAEIEMLKPTAILLNTARGGLVDEGALTEALRTGRIAGAGMDVFAIEPLPAGSPLTALSNVVLTPHSAGVTPETVEAGLRLSIENVFHWLAGAPANVVAAA
jgi:D-3-phosphoglycerate dehydrogenase